MFPVGKLRNCIYRGKSVEYSFLGLSFTTIMQFSVKEVDNISGLISDQGYQDEYKVIMLFILREIIQNNYFLSWKM
jgi:hypothetical protein